MVGGRFMVGAFPVYLVGALFQPPNLKFPVMGFSLDDTQIKGSAKLFHLRLGFLGSLKASPRRTQVFQYRRLLLLPRG